MGTAFCGCAFSFTGRFMAGVVGPVCEGGREKEATIDYPRLSSLMDRDN